MELERLKLAIAALVNQMLGNRLDYFALYEARVVSDHGDNTFDVQPDDQRLPPMSKVPVDLFVPGATVQVASGARVLVGFAAGDPSKPRVRLFTSGQLMSLNLPCQSITLAGGGPAVARVGDGVQITIPSGMAAGTYSGTITGGSSKVLCG